MGSALSSDGPAVQRVTVRLNEAEISRLQSAAAEAGISSNKLGLMLIRRALVRRYPDKINALTASRRENLRKGQFTFDLSSLEVNLLGEWSEKEGIDRSSLLRTLLSTTS